MTLFFWLFTNEIIRSESGMKLKRRSNLLAAGSAIFTASTAIRFAHVLGHRNPTRRLHHAPRTTPAVRRSRRIPVPLSSLTPTERRHRTRPCCHRCTSRATVSDSHWTMATSGCIFRPRSHGPGAARRGVPDRGRAGDWGAAALHRPEAARIRDAPIPTAIDGPIDNGRCFVVRRSLLMIFTTLAGRGIRHRLEAAAD